MAITPWPILAQVALRVQELEAQETQAPLAPIIPALEWMFTYRKFLKAGVPFDLENHQYLREPYSDECGFIVVMKAGQMGVSEWGISLAARYASHLGLNVIYLLPNAGEVSEFSATRFGPAVSPDASPELAALIVGGRGGGVDRVTLKRLGKGIIYFVGGTVSAKGTAPQLHSKAADVLMLDEFNLIDTRAIPLAEQRLGHSRHKIRCYFSTPTYKNVGIHSEYLASDRRKWFIPCPHCGERNTPAIENLVIESDDLERPIAWNKDSDGKACLCCVHCGGILDRHAAGEWVPEIQNHEPHGYHISGLISAYKDLDAIIGQRGVKPTGLQSLSETVRKEVINQDIGDPYTPTYAQTLDDATLDACRREYLLGPVTGARDIAFAGIDVGRVLHVIIRGADWSLRAVQQCRWGDLRALLRAHRVVCGVMDGEPETTQARQIQAMFLADKPNSFWLADYPPAGIMGINPAIFDQRQMVVKLDRTRCLDLMYSLFRVSARGEPHGATLPANARDIPDYYSHMKAPERTIERNSKGLEIAVYKEGSKADHYAHAEVYCLSAALWWANPANAEYKAQYAPVRIV